MMGWKDVSRRSLIAAGRRFARDHGGRRVILCYHSIHSGNSFRSASPALFAAHLEWLSENCSVVPLQRLVTEAHSPLPSGQTQVSVTFDDGYRDNFETALPLLQKHGLVATFFATVGLLEGSGARVQLFARPDELVAMTWAQSRDMVSAGMEMGVHGYTHLNLGTADVESVRHEVVDAKRVMEDAIGQEVCGFAYPYGKKRHYSREVVTIVRDAGYRYAVAISSRAVRPRDSLWALPRLFVTNDTIEQLQAKVRGDWDLVGWAQDAIPTTLSRIVSPRDH